MIVFLIGFLVYVFSTQLLLPVDACHNHKFGFQSFGLPEKFSNNSERAMSSETGIQLRPIRLGVPRDTLGGDDRVSFCKGLTLSLWSEANHMVSKDSL